MYLAQMIYMGRTHGARLFEGAFQAWDYGPVEPDLYHKAKMFGSGPVKDVFGEARRFADNDPRIKLMDDICGHFLKYSAGDLVEITHSDKGAWAKHYVPRARNISIPDEDILEEYRNRNAIGFPGS